MSSVEQQSHNHERSCPRCGARMEWFRSEANMARRTVTNVFSCTRCNAIETVTGTLSTEGDPDFRDV
jgi:transcription elongation factor Elf1